jgi:hypothetical protein
VLTVSFTLNASATYGGTVTKNPDQANYAANTAVTLTASPVSVYAFTGWSGAVTGTNNPITLTLNSNKTVVANFVSPVADLIVDNPAASFVGTWSLDTSAADEYGADYRTTSTTPNASATATATFTPAIPATGAYDVYIWFPTIAKGSASVPVVISGASGNTVVTVNEVSGSGGWLLLATNLSFAAGTNGFVQLGNNTGQGGKSMTADAVRWVYSENQSVTPPTITMQPTNQTIVAGQNATFTVGASGSAPLNCQWHFNTAAVSGQTNGWFTVSNAQATNAGNYMVIITNTAGSVTSLVATLTINIPPGITTQPVSQRVVQGSNALFSVTANGTQPLTFQWRYNTAPLAGKTNASLQLSQVQPVQAGAYDVIVSNVAGTTTSAPADLMVSIPPLFGLITVQPDNHAHFTLNVQRETVTRSKRRATW